jgi:hypothetical protein
VEDKGRAIPNTKRLDACPIIALAPWPSCASFVLILSLDTFIVLILFFRRVETKACGMESGQKDITAPTHLHLHQH